MNTEYKQAQMERICLYIDQIQSVTGKETPEKFHAVTALYQYILTPEVKLLFQATTEEGARARAVMLKKTTDYTHYLCKIANLWIFLQHPELTRVLDEMMYFLTDGIWGATCRRSPRLVKKSLHRYDQSCKSNVELYAQLTANSAHLAELHSEEEEDIAAPRRRRAKVTVKILPRRSARLLQQQ